MVRLLSMATKAAALTPQSGAAARAAAPPPWRSLRLGAKSLFQSVYDPRNAVLDQGHIEVDQQAESLVRQPQIGKKLLLANCNDLRQGFDFDNHFVLYYQIGAKAHFKTGPLLGYGYRLLSRDA